MFFGKVDPEAVQVELIAAEAEGRDWRQPMTRGDKLPNREGGYLFTCKGAGNEAGRPISPPGLSLTSLASLCHWRYRSFYGTTDYRSGADDGPMGTA